MNDRIRAFAVILLVAFGAGESQAQTGKLLPPFVQFGLGSYYMYPTDPTSSDTVKLSLSRYMLCGGSSGAGFTPGNLYRVSMVQNIITVALAINTAEFAYPSAGCYPASPDMVEIGRLPAGNYILNVVEPESPYSLRYKLVENYAFTVTDARAAKAAPWVRLDFSGHWWDPADSGWGLFIWQDARSPTDSILAAWFTYTPDGKSAWYVFQPEWENHSATKTAALQLTGRPPGLTSPPPGNTSTLSVGTASLDFTDGGPGAGKLTYKFGDGPPLVRIIRRFMQ